MIKGILSMIFGAIFTAAIIVGIIYLLFSGILIWLFGAFIISVIVAAILLFVILFVFLLLLFFAFFYYVAEKKPSVKPGEYSFDMEKGKHEK